MSALHAFLSRSFWRRCLTLCGAIFAFVVLGLASNVSTASAANGINRQINYQAKLSDALGFPVADGTYSFKFSLYDAASGGAVLWTASGTTATPLPLTVNISNGLFTVMLGDTSSTSGSQNPLNDAVAWNSDNLYLGVTVGADSEMSPRKRLAAAPYAFNAERLQGMYASGTAFGANNLFSINQTSNTAATGTRTALEVRSAGTSDANDFLIRGVNDLGSGVFSLNRQGNVTSTGILTVTGSGTSTFVGSVSSTGAVFDRYLTVRGQSVCLADGTNCIGGASTDTFASVTTRGASATTTLSMFGGATVSFLSVTSTFGVSSTASFEGDVLLGNASSDVITPNGRFNGDILPSSDQEYAIGSTTSRWNAYFANATVTGQLSGVIASNSTFTSVSSVVVQSLANVRQGHVEGNILYVISGGGVSALYAFDISQPEQPRRLGSIGVGSELTFFDVQGRYAYIVTTAGSLHIVDIKNPANMLLVATASIAGFGNGIHVAGKYAYIIDDIRFRVYDVSDPTNPFQVSQSGLYTNLNSLDVRGKYAYVFESSGSRNFRIFDVSNPNEVTEVGSVSVGGTVSGMGIVARDGYAYLSGNSSQLFTINITDPTAPYVQTTSTGVFSNDGTSRGFVSIGNYLIGKSALLSMRVMDVTDPTAPTSVKTFATTAFNPRSPIVAGNYLYVFDGSSVTADINVIRLPGMRAATFEAGSVLTEGLQVIDSARFGNNVDILSGLSVYDGIRSFGALSVYAPTVTSSFIGDVSVIGTVSTTNLFVSSQRVCLESGANCPVSGGSTDSNWAYNAAGNFLRMVSSTNDVVFGNTVTSTGAGAYFDLSGGANGTSTIYFGFATNTNVILGGTSTTQTGMNNLFTMNGNDLFVNGNVGSASSVYTNGAFYAGTTTWLGDGVVTSTNVLRLGGSAIYQDASSVFFNLVSFAGSSKINSDFIPYVDSFNTLGISSLRWRGFFSDATTTNLYVTGFVSTTQLTVGGNTVCLTDGTNCPSTSGGTDSNWAYNAAGNFLRMVTSTNDVVLGNTVTSTGAGAYFDLSGGQNGTSTVYFGFATNTNVVLGGSSTTQTGLHPNFVMDGNDLFVNGNIGSASSVYTNGAFVAGTGTTRLSDGLIAKTNGVLTITTASGTRVQNSIDNTLDTAHVMGLVTSTHLTQNAIQNVLIRGRYAYVYHDTGRFTIMDMSDPSNPAELSTTYIGAAAAYNSFDVSGNYLYYYDYTRLQIFDLSNPRNPRLVGSVSGLTSNGEIKVAGSYAYIVSVGNYFVINVADPANPFVAGALGSGVGAGEQSVQNGYAYVTGDFGNTFNVVDVRNPAKPVMAYASTTIAQTPNSLVTQGRYAYMAYHDNGAIDIIDIASSTSPITVKRFATGEANLGSKNVLSIQGRYLYVLGDFDFRVFDVSSSTNPVLVNTSANFGVNAFANGIAVSGRYAYIGLTSPTNVLVYDVLGTETNGLQAASAEFGTMTVRNDAVIAGRADLLGGLSVGLSGIRSDGALSVNAYGATSTFKGDVMVQGTVSTTALYVNSQSVCLVNGTNCPISGSSGTSTVDFNWRYTALGDYVRLATSTSDLVLGNTATSTGAAAYFDLSGGQNGTSTVYLGFATNTNVVLGGTSTTQTGLNSLFTMNGNDLFVNGNIGSVSSVYTNGAFVAGTGTTMYAAGSLTNTNGTFAITSASGTRVSGALQQDFTSLTKFRIASTTDEGGISGYHDVKISGRYAYVVANGLLKIWDIGNIGSPTSVGAITGLNGPFDVEIQGNFAYVQTNGGGLGIRIFDISNPATITEVGHTGDFPGTFEPIYSVEVQGRYAYTTYGGAFTGKLAVVEVANPTSPTSVAYLSLTSPTYVEVEGRYAYVLTNSGTQIDIVDLQDPIHPVLVSSVTGFGTITTFAVTDKNLFISDSGPLDDLFVYDVSNAAAPYLIANIDTSSNAPVKIQRLGKYLVQMSSTDMTIIDVSNPRNPTVVTGSVDLSDIGGMAAFDISGNKMVVAYDSSSKKLGFVELPGLEASTLAAGSAEIGGLNVLEDANIWNTLKVGNAVGVGLGGISSLGSLSVYATNTTSTIVGSLEVAGLTSSTSLLVSGYAVCLVNGTNCPAASAPDWIYTATGNFIRASTSTANLLIGGTSTTQTGLNSQFVINGNDLFVNGNIGSVSSVYTNGEFVAGSGSLHMGDGYISQNTGNLTLNSAGGYILPASDMALTFGSSTLRFNGEFGNVSSTNLFSNGRSKFAINTASPIVQSSVTALNAGGSFNDMFVNNHFLIVTDYGANEYRIYDATKPSAPELIVTSSTPSGTSGPWRPYIAGSYLYMPMFDSDSVAIINVFGQSQVGTMTGLNNVDHVQVNGQYAYVAYDSNVAIFDVRNPTDPVRISTVSTDGGRNQGMDVYGKLILVANGGGSNRLQAINANNPYSPFMESSLLLDGNLSSVNVLNDTYAVVTDYSGHVYMVNKTFPNAMVNVSTSTIGSVINRAELEGNYLYATNEGAGEVYVVDVSDPYNVQLVKTITGVPNAFSIKVKGKTAYTVPIGTDHNLRIFDLGGLEASNFVAHSAELGSMSVLMDGTIGGNLYVDGGATIGANGLMSQGTLASATSVYANGAFVAGGHSTYYADGYIRKNNGPLTMSSVSGTMFLTTKPYIESQIVASGSNPRVMRTQGHYLYVTEFTAGKVAVYDVQDPAEPVFLDDVAVGSAPQSLVVDGNHLYVGTGNQLYSIDISNPYSLATDGSPLSTGNIDSMVKVGPYLYVVDSTADSILTVDVSNPASMKKVNYASTGGTNPLAIDTDGKALYVVDDASDNMKVYSAQFNPQLISTVALAAKNPQAVAVNGLYAYVLTNDAGGGHLRVIDISAGSEVSNVALGTSLFTNSIQVRGNYVYLVTDDNTLQVYDVTDAYVPVRVQRSDATLNQVNGIWVDGRYAYFTNDNDDKLVIMNLGGADASALHAGSLKAGQLDVDQNAQVGQNLMVNGGISAGRGFQVTGPSSISGQTSSATLQVINTGGNAGGAAWGAYINRLLVADATDAGLSSTGTANYQTLIKYTGTGGFAGLCLDDSTNGLSCPQVTGGASLLADNAVTANAFDLAEQYALNGSATATDLLIQVTTSTNTVKQSEAVPYDSRILGVYSTRPGFLLGWNQGVPVALTGRVPLKVSAVNGAITAGDPLTSSGIAGYAMKATHPGMIVGYALDSTSTTSTIDIFVKVGYDAKMALGTDAAGTITAVTDDLVFTATSTATALAPTSDSFGLTFRGSAWNGSAAVSEGYRMFTDILSATSSQFTIQNNSSTNVFTINKSGSAQLTGDLQIGGKLYPSGRGTIQHDKYIYLDDSAAPTSTYMATNADGWQSNSSYDFAERYYSPDALEPGDLVVVSRTGELHVQRSLDATTMLAGIVSTKPGFVTGAPATSTFPIALSGRVPTKVSTVKGNIVTGDPLAPSTIPGVAVKATEAGPIVGYALQDYDQTGVGKIEVFVNPVWWGGDLAKLVQDAANAAANTSNVNTNATNGKTAQGLAVMKAGAKQLHIAYASIKAYPNVQVTPRGEVVGTWWTDGYSDTGFDIYLKQAQDRDVTFTWRVEATAEGEDLFYSDGTASKVDSLLGAPLVGTQTVVTPTATTTSMPSPAPETTTTTEETPPVPTVEPTPDVTPEPAPTTTEPAADPATTTTP